MVARKVERQDDWRTEQAAGRHEAAALAWLHERWGASVRTRWLPSRTLEARMAHALADEAAREGLVEAWRYASPLSRPVIRAARHCRWWIRHRAHEQLGCRVRRLWLYPDLASKRRLPMDEAEMKVAEMIGYMRAKAETGRAKQVARAAEDRAEVRAMRAKGVPVNEIVKCTKLPRSTVYRHLEGGDDGVPSVT